MNIFFLWILIVFVCSFAVWLICAFLLDRSLRATVFLVLLGLASVGATVGIIGGLSRVGVAGEVLAAALGLVGVVATWLFAVDTSKGTIVSVCTIVFSLSLFVAYIESSSRRAAPESYIFWREYCANTFLSANEMKDAKSFMLKDAAVGSLCAEIFKAEKKRLID